MHYNVDYDKTQTTKYMYNMLVTNEDIPVNTWSVWNPKTCVHFIFIEEKKEHNTISNCCPIK